LYYGNANDASDNSTTTGVWNTGYRGAWHLSDTVVDEGYGLAAHRDSSAYNNYINQYGNNEVSARYYRGQEFDGDDYAIVPSNSSLNISSNLTISGWFYVSEGSNWKYKRTITLSSSTPLSNYQVKIELSTTTFDYSKAKADGADLRFYDLGEAALDYWIETWSSTGTSRIWIKIPDLGTSQFYMYYGNDGAASQSSGADTFDFFDDFSGSSLGAQWHPDANDYSVSGGALRINIGGVGLENPLPFNMNSGYVVESRLMYLNSTGAYSGTLSAQSARYTGSGNGASAATNLYMRNGATQPARWTGSGSAASYNCGNGNVGSVTSNGVWYVLSAAFDSIQVNLARDRGAYSAYGCGWTKNINYLSLGDFMGIAATDYQDTSYDWVLVRKYATSSASYSLGSERGRHI
jgi:hypothetical protein